MRVRVRRWGVRGVASLWAGVRWVSFWGWEAARCHYSCRMACYKFGIAHLVVEQLARVPVKLQALSIVSGRAGFAYAPFR